MTSNDGSSKKTKYVLAGSGVCLYTTGKFIASIKSVKCVQNNDRM